MKKTSFAWQFIAMSLACVGIAQAEEPTVFTLDAIIQKAFIHSPRLKSADAVNLASEGGVIQAAALPNPEISLETENFAGSGDYRGLRSAEVTYGVSQVIETGGKRAARKQMAAQSQSLSEYDKQAVQLDVIRDVTVAYMQVIAAEAQVEIAREEKTFASDVLKTVTTRVEAAADPLYLRSKAEVEDVSSAISLAKAEREARTARRKLNALSGLDAPMLLDEGIFLNLPEVEEAWGDILENPDVKRYTAAIEHDIAAYDFEKANALPDPRVNVGVRDLRDSGDQAFVLGVSLPIPVFNANHGNIRKARYARLKTEADKQTVEIELFAQLEDHRQQMEEAQLQAESLKNTVIPAAEKAFEQARYGYGLGKFPYLEVLDGQRTLFDTREQYIASLLQYHISRAEAERLTGKHGSTTFEEISYAE